MLILICECAFAVDSSEAFLALRLIYEEVMPVALQHEKSTGTLPYDKSEFEEFSKQNTLIFNSNKYCTLNVSRENEKKYIVRISLNYSILSIDNKNLKNTTGCSEQQIIPLTIKTDQKKPTEEEIKNELEGNIRKQLHDAVNN